MPGVHTCHAASPRRSSLLLLLRKLLLRRVQLVSRQAELLLADAFHLL